MQKDKTFITFIFIIVLLFTLQFSLALVSDINIKSKPSTIVYVKVLHNEGPYAGKLINNQSNLKFTSSLEGKIAFTYNLDKESSLRISAKSNEMESFVIYKDIPNGKIVLLDLTNPTMAPIISKRPDGAVPTMSPITEVSASPSPSEAVSLPTNSTNNTTANAVPPVTNTKKSSIFDSLIFKILLYTIVGLFLISLIIFIVISGIKAYRERQSEHHTIRTVKFSDKFHSPHPHLKTLEDAERKLLEAQGEINKLKYKEKEIKDIERRIREDEYRLKKLRGY